MGIYNQPGQKDILGSECVLCKSSNIREFDDGKGRDSYDYICNDCNPNVIICCSSWVLTGHTREELRTNENARNEIRSDLENCQEKFYYLSFRNVSYFLGHDYEDENRIFTYDNWVKGDMPGIAGKYKNINEEELSKIVEDQKRIKHTNIEESVQLLINDFDERKEKSINAEVLLQKEIEKISQLLAGKLNSVTLLNETYDDESIQSILKIYELAVNGDDSYYYILSPSQTRRIGTSRQREKQMIFAHSLNLYLDYLKKLLRSNNSEDKLLDQEIVEINQKLDEVVEMLRKQGVGQEVIFDEIDSFRTKARTFSKKDFYSIVTGRLVELVGLNIIESSMATDIYNKITGEILKIQ